MQSVDSLFELAVAEQRAGRLQQAYPFYQAVLARDPRHHSALFLLAGLDLAQGRAQPAAQGLERAVQLSPGQAAYHSNLGLAYRQLGDTERAARAFTAAIQLNPEQVEAHFQLGQLLLEQGDLNAALLGLRQAAELRPQSFPIQHQLARALLRAERHDQAVAHYHCALALDPSSLAACLELLALLRRLGRLAGAKTLARRVLALDPKHAQARELLGAILIEQGQFDEAVDQLELVTQLSPGSRSPRERLALALWSAGRVTETLALCERGVRDDPGDPQLEGSLVYAAGFDPALDAERILQLARRWEERHARPLYGQQRPHANERSPERRLRVAYVSPDFREHCQSFFTLPVLSQHDREQLEVLCYSSVAAPDAWTARLQQHADVWRDVRALSDGALAAQIREDRVDVLMDLTMHMRNGRLLMFAEKPAPVQISWLAYPGTTGLSAIDYRITDPYLDPPGAALPYAEQTLRLPHSFWCYDPFAQGPEAGDLPALASGHVTFGSLNHPCKTNAAVLELWARVLRSVRDARLVLLMPAGSARRRALEVFAAQGIESQRIEFTERLAHARYLELHQRIDIALDTLPYNGHTTSLDALWMGVPVVTLVGRTIVGRAGLSQASNLGLPEWVAQTPEQFVDIATDASRDLPRLRALRSGLRERLRASPIMDATRFTRDLEAAYRVAWRRWCTADGSSSARVLPGAGHSG